MLDIKVKKKIQIKIDKIPETEADFSIVKNEVVEAKEETVENVSKTPLLSGILFVFMIFTASTYIFMVSSSVYFAVNESKYNYKGESFKNTNLTVVTAVDDSDGEKEKGADQSRITYINVDADHNISLK